MGTVCNIGWEELYDACNGNILGDALFWGVVRDEEKKEDGGGPRRGNNETPDINNLTCVSLTALT